MSQNGSILSGGAVSYALSVISTKKIDLDLKTTKRVNGKEKTSGNCPEICDTPPMRNDALSVGESGSLGKASPNLTALLIK